jgi:hypothetical protein
MRLCCSSATVEIAEFRIPYTGAGLVITNGSSILCGYEPHKRKPAIYGIGGKRESEDPTYRHTAFREAVEELFGIRQIPPAVFAKLVSQNPYRIEDVGGYIMLYYSFADLEYFLRVLKSQKTPFYSRMPRGLSELLTERRVEVSTETTHLCILPIINPVPVISADLAHDIIRIHTSKIMQPL